MRDPAVGIGGVDLREREVGTEADALSVERGGDGVSGSDRVGGDGGEAGQLQVVLAGGNHVLQHLAHHVDVGQSRQGVVAVELEEAQVGAAAEEHVPDRLRGICRLAVLEEHQQVGEVRGGAEHRTAMLAFAEVAGCEQIVPVGERRESLAVVLQRQGQGFGVQRLEVGDDRQHRGMRVGGAVPGEACGLGGEAGTVGVAPHELALAQAVDLLGGVEIIRQQGVRRLEGRGELEHPLDSLDLEPEVLILRQCSRVRVEVIFDVSIHRRGQQFEVLVAIEERCQLLCLTQPVRAAVVQGPLQTAGEGGRREGFPELALEHPSVHFSVRQLYLIGHFAYADGQIDVARGVPGHDQIHPFVLAPLRERADLFRLANAELLLEHLDYGEIAPGQVGKLEGRAQVRDLRFFEGRVLLQGLDQLRRQRLVLVEQAGEGFLLLGITDPGILQRQPDERGSSRPTHRLGRGELQERLDPLGNVLLEGTGDLSLVERANERLVRGSGVERRQGVKNRL